MGKKTCPHCGGSLDGFLDEVFRERQAMIGSRITAKKTRASRENALKAAAAANAAYTPEKRAKAAQKRRETMLRKNLAQ